MPKLRNVAAVVAGTVTLGGAAIWFTVRPWWHRWGVDPDEAVRRLPGDEVVPGGRVVRGAPCESQPERPFAPDQPVAPDRPIEPDEPQPAPAG